MDSRRTAKTQRYLLTTLTLFTATIALGISIATLSLNSAVAAQPGPVDERGHLSQNPMQEISVTLGSSGFNPAEVRPDSGRTYKRRSYAHIIIVTALVDLGPRQGVDIRAVARLERMLPRRVVYLFEKLAD